MEQRLIALHKLSKSRPLTDADLATLENEPMKNIFKATLTTIKNWTTSKKDSYMSKITKDQLEANLAKVDGLQISDDEKSIMKVMIQSQLDERASEIDAPVSTDPVVTPAPVESAPVDPVVTAPVDVPPVVSAPVESTPGESAPVESTPVVVSPIETAPVDVPAPAPVDQPVPAPVDVPVDAPVPGESAPVESAPVETPAPDASAPVETVPAPVESTPVVDAPAPVDAPAQSEPSEPKAVWPADDEIVAALVTKEGETAMDNRVAVVYAAKKLGK